MMENNAGNKFAFDAIKIGMASPEQIRCASLVNITWFCINPPENNRPPTL